MQEDEAGARKKKQTRTLKSKPQQEGAAGGPRHKVARAPSAGAGLPGRGRAVLNADAPAVTPGDAPIGGGGGSPSSQRASAADPAASADGAATIAVPQRRISSQPATARSNSNAALFQQALQQRNAQKGSGPSS